VTRPTYEELADLVASQAAIIKEQAAEIARLKARVADLEARRAGRSSWADVVSGDRSG